MPKATHELCATSPVLVVMSNGSPKWSADGKEIVFYSSQYGSGPGNQQSRIWVMSADGSNPGFCQPAPIPNVFAGG